MAPLGYAGYRFPSDLIQRAVWMYLRFTLSYRDVEDLLAERSLEVSYETGLSRTEAAKIGGVTLQIVRDWVLKLGSDAVLLVIA